MSVVKIGLLPGRESSFGKITEGKAKLRWLAETDNNLDNESLIASYGYGNNILPIPYVGTHPLYPVMLCREISFKQDSSAPRKWEIDATYSSEPLSKSEQESEVENPLERPAKVKWKTNQYRKAVVKDKNGNAITNSAGDYFDPPPEIDSSHWTVTVTKNVAAVPQFILDYDNAINTNSFSIQGVSVAQFVAKLMDIDIGEVQTEGDFVFLVFTYSMEFRPDELWGLSELDQGMRFKSGNDRKQILDNSSPPRPITTPKLLDGNGAVLSNPTPETAVFRDFDVYKERDFSVLPGISEIANPPDSSSVDSSTFDQDETAAGEA